MAPMVKLKTTCDHTIWSGFFGINADGYQPECGTEIEIEVKEEEVERDNPPGIRPSFSTRCPKCKALLEWPQEWEEIKN